MHNIHKASTFKYLHNNLNIYFGYNAIHIIYYTYICDYKCLLTLKYGYHRWMNFYNDFNLRFYWKSRLFINLLFKQILRYTRINLINNAIFIRSHIGTSVSLTRLIYLHIIYNIISFRNIFVFIALEYRNVYTTLYIYVILCFIYNGVCFISVIYPIFYLHYE